MFYITYANHYSLPNSHVQTRINRYGITNMYFGNICVYFRNFYYICGMNILNDTAAGEKHSPVRKYIPKRWRRMTDLILFDADNHKWIDYGVRQSSGWYTIMTERRNVIDPIQFDMSFGILTRSIFPHHKNSMLHTKYSKDVKFNDNILYGQILRSKITVWYPTPAQYCDYGRIPPG